MCVALSSVLRRGRYFYEDGSAAFESLRLRGIFAWLKLFRWLRLSKPPMSHYKTEYLEIP